MGKLTIKQKVFTYNLVILTAFVLMTAVVFNLTVSMYLEGELDHQLSRVLDHTVKITLKQGPAYFKGPGENDRPPRKLDEKDDMGFYFMLERSLRDSLTVVNAEYLLLNPSFDPIRTPENKRPGYNDSFARELVQALASEQSSPEIRTRLNLNNRNYLVLGTAIGEQNSIGLGWIIIYADLSQIDQLQKVINEILLLILIIAGILSATIASGLAKQFARPFDAITAKLQALSGREYGDHLEVEAADELGNLIRQVNHMSEALEAYDNAQKTFLQNVSHEFKTPLMAIQGHAEAILHDVLPPAEAAEIIVEETHRLNVMVNQLLYLSRLEAIDEVLDCQPVDLKSLIQTVVKRFEPTALQKNIALSIAAPEQALLLADEEKLMTALSNLLANACRYAKTAVTVTLETTTSHSGQATYQLIVEDDGPGFTAEDLGKAFDRYYSGKGGQSGLGLAIAKRVADMHQGHIHAENTDTGARVVMVFGK